MLKATRVPTTLASRSTDRVGPVEPVLPAARSRHDGLPRARDSREMDASISRGSRSRAAYGVRSSLSGAFGMVQYTKPRDTPLQRFGRGVAQAFRGRQNIAAWIVAGFAIYYLDVIPREERKEEQEEARRITERLARENLARAKAEAES